MSGKELYEMYAGRKAESFGGIGIICGYGNVDMIMSVSEISCTHKEEYQHPGWTEIDDVDVIMSNDNNPLGYHYAIEENIID